MQTYLRRERGREFKNSCCGQADRQTGRQGEREAMLHTYTCISCIERYDRRSRSRQPYYHPQNTCSSESLTEHPSIRPGRQAGRQANGTNTSDKRAYIQLHRHTRTHTRVAHTLQSAYAHSCRMQPHTHTHTHTQRARKRTEHTESKWFATHTRHTLRRTDG